MEAISEKIRYSLSYRIRDKADAYGKIMKDIATGHQKLYDSRNKWTTESLLKDVAPIIEDLDDSAQKVKEAF